MTTQTRQQEIQQLWKEYQGLYVIAGVLIGLLLFPLLELIVTDLSQLLIGLVPEAVGIGFTVFFLDRIYQNREEVKYKQQLIVEMGSLDNSTALRAAEALNDKGWAQDGTLVGARLREANLKNIRIKYAKLSRAHLVSADLRNGEMYHADFSRVQMSDSLLRGSTFNVSSFENAVICHADFRNSRLRSCNFRGALLDSSDFENADLSKADLRGADLIGANLQNVEFGEGLNWKPTVQMDENTILPDGHSWHEGIRLKRYTDPEHEDFWRPKPLTEYDLERDYYDFPFWWRRQYLERNK